MWILLITNPEDVERFFGIASEDVEKAAEAAATEFGLVAMAMTLRQTPSVCTNTVSAVGHAGGQP